MQFTYDSVTILSVSGLIIAAYYYIYPPKNSMSLNSFANIFFNKFHPLKIHLKLNKKKRLKHWTLIEIKIGSEFTLHDLIDPWHPILNKSLWKFLAPLFSFISVMTASAALLLVVRLYCLMVSKMGDIIVYIFLVSIIKPIFSFNISVIKNIIMWFIPIILSSFRSNAIHKEYDFYDSIFIYQCNHLDDNTRNTKSCPSFHFIWIIKL